MAELKVMTPTTNSVEGPKAATNVVDENNKEALALEKQLGEMTSTLQKKKYRVKTTEEVVNYLMEDFYANVVWNGYECYAISETNKTMSKIVSKLKPSKTGKVSFSMPADLLQALFHFIKGHTNTGLELASKHRSLCEDMSVPMSELNHDHAELREIATQAEAKKHGIPVEEYKRVAAQQQMGNGMPRQ